MTDPNLDITRLSSRISALEKANRRWMMAGLLLFIFLMAAGFLTGYNAYAQRTMPRHIANAVAAHEFVLMGQHGELRGRLGVVNGKPALQFYNKARQLWWYAPPKMRLEPVKNK